MLTVKDLLCAFADQLIARRCDDNVSFRRVSNDSRATEPGDLFFALRTENRDGHTFIEDAQRRGAAAVVTEEPPATGAFFQVRDTRAALGRLAACWRRRFDVKVIGVTGNVGKTTTKEAIAALLGSRFQVRKSAATFNNELG